MDIVVGEKTNPIATDQLIEELIKLDLDGTLYVGYPVLATADETICIDALLLSERHGLIVFHFPKNDPSDIQFWSAIERDQDDIFVAITQKLMVHRSLRKGRDPAITPTILCYISFGLDIPEDSQVDLVVANSLDSKLSSLPRIQGEYYRPLVAALQRVSTIKPIKKRISVNKKGSRGDILKAIEKEIANLDRWQTHAAIENPDGPQCIRGLAGSGKTVVLALKAAFLHARNPEWKIAVTFHTRTLYQQFRDLIRRFSFEHLGDEPDWSNLKVLHSWGSNSEPGVYSEIASANNIRPKNFEEARMQYGRGEAFSGICEELADAIGSKETMPLYDVLLIDEAQDFPKSFFQLVYKKSVTEHHRIVWAYDELQNLSDYGVLPPEELFGTDEDGKPLESLQNINGKPKQDIMLPICYRNTPWALTVAHAIGFGIYRERGLVQLFENAGEAVWKNLGYSLISGSAEPGQRIVLKRGEDSAPKYSYDLMKPEDSVSTMVFKNPTEQAKWVTESIAKNLSEDELEHSDILIVLPNPLSVRSEANPLRSMLKSAGISSHLAGITSSRDELFQDNSIAITGIYRAKGNEAPMVYILNSQYAYEGPELIRRRNTLFTAITRSKAWVRICGCGSNMEQLRVEIDKLIKNDYQLDFIVPSPEELAELRKIYRDITRDERQKIIGLADLLESIERGDLSMEHIPEKLRNRLRKQLE